MLGVIEMAVFGVLAGLVARSSTWSAAEIQDFLGVERITYDNAVTLQTLLLPAAASIATLGVLPGIAYVLASFKITRGSSVAITLAMILAMMQLFVLGALLLRQAGAAFAAGDPPALTINVLVLGTPMVGLLYVLRLLIGCRIAMQARNVAQVIAAARRELNQ